MSGLRSRIEVWFETLGNGIYRHRYKTLIAASVFIAVLVSQIPNVTVDTSTEGFLHHDDPSLLAYEAFRDQFGRDQVAIVALKPPAVFDLTFLRRLKDLHEDLEANLPYLDEVTSLINARNTRGEADELIVEDLLENWPQSAEDLAEIKSRALANPMYRNMLLSADGRFTTIVIQTVAHAPDPMATDSLDEFEDPSGPSPPAATPRPAGSRRNYLTDAQNGEFVVALNTVLKRHPLPNTRIYAAGTPVVTHFLKRAMMTDMRKFMGVAIVTIGVFLLIMFRRVSGVVIPLVVVILSLLSTIGLMAATGTAIKLPTQILPSFILAVGVGDSVHILVIFFRRFNARGNKQDAIAFALGHSGLAVLMTSLTTAAGLLSFSNAAVAPVADLGRFAAAGVMLALTYTIILLPALLAIIPLRPKQPAAGDADGNPPLADRLLDRIGRQSIDHPYRVVTVSALLLAASAVSLPDITFSHNPLKWFPPVSDVRIANEAIDQEMRGSTSLEVVVDTGRENGLYHPDILNRLEASIHQMEQYRSDDIFVGKAWSLTTVLKEINQALHGNDKEFYSIPQDRDLVAQEFLLFENSGSDDLEDFTDSQFSKARMVLKVPFIDAIAFTRFIEHVRAHFETTYPDAKVQVTGMVAILATVITAAIESMRESYGYALVVISILMMVLIGRVRIGLLSMIPNIAPIVFTLGIMGWLNIPMNLFSMLVGSIAIGLAVDDTIHFMHNFRRYFEQTGDAEIAVLETLHSTGRAMMVTTGVLSIGFFTFMFASMRNLFEFGMLTGITLIMALLSDFFLAPALMIIVNRKRHKD